MLIASLREVLCESVSLSFIARASRANNAGEWNQAISFLIEAHARPTRRGRERPRYTWYSTTWV